MRPGLVLLFGILLSAATACQPTIEIPSESAPGPTVVPPQGRTVPPTQPLSSTAQVETHTPLSLQPTPSDPSEKEIPWSIDRMPIFLEVTQTTSMSSSTTKGPAIGVGPAIYYYNPDSKVLLLKPTVELESTTELMVGSIDVLQTPDQVFEKRDILQYPSAQPVLIRIAALDLGTGRITILYGDEKFDLLPGKNRTFKKSGIDSNTPGTITIISNYGFLKEIQPILSDGSLR